MKRRLVAGSGSRKNRSSQSLRAQSREALGNLARICSSEAFASSVRPSATLAATMNLAGPNASGLYAAMSVAVSGSNGYIVANHGSPQMRRPTRVNSLLWTEHSMRPNACLTGSKGTNFNWRRSTGPRRPHCTPKS